MQSLFFCWAVTWLCVPVLIYQWLPHTGWHTNAHQETGTEAIHPHKLTNGADILNGSESTFGDSNGLSRGEDNKKNATEDEILYNGSSSSNSSARIKGKTGALETVELSQSPPLIKGQMKVSSTRMVFGVGDMADSPQSQSRNEQNITTAHHRMIDYKHNIGTPIFRYLRLPFITTRKKNLSDKMKTLALNNTTKSSPSVQKGEADLAAFAVNASAMQAQFTSGGSTNGQVNNVDGKILDNMHSNAFRSPNYPVQYNTETLLINQTLNSHSNKNTLPRRPRREAGNIFTEVMGLDANLDNVIDDFIGADPKSRERERRTVGLDEGVVRRLHRYLRRIAGDSSVHGDNHDSSDPTELARFLGQQEPEHDHVIKRTELDINGSHDTGIQDGRPRGDAMSLKSSLNDLRGNMYTDFSHNNTVDSTFSIPAKDTGRKSSNHADNGILGKAFHSSEDQRQTDNFSQDTEHVYPAGSARQDLTSKQQFLFSNRLNNYSKVVDKNLAEGLSPLFQQYTQQKPKGEASQNPHGPSIDGLEAGDLKLRSGKRRKYENPNKETELMGINIAKVFKLSLHSVLF